MLLNPQSSTFRKGNQEWARIGTGAAEPRFEHWTKNDMNGRVLVKGAACKCVVRWRAAYKPPSTANW
jgi:hypothetical protein